MNISKISWAPLAIAALCMGSCAKTDPAAPQSKQTLKVDLRSAQKEVSLNNGSALLQGSGSPATDIGESGDYYIDNKASDLYGPKKDAGWGDPLILSTPKANMHQQGTGHIQTSTEPSGQDNVQILSGVSSPKTSEGKPGDYYLDMPHLALYGPKTISGWGPCVTL